MADLSGLNPRGERIADSGIPTEKGKDYMKYPPKEERKPKHCGVFDPEKPYTEYLSKLSGLFDVCA